ncbi:dipeptide epimerase [Thalassotalea sp. G2M2-11]|uniref:dipeptide epimerase n=1 Tax=Thalassotalea sp. G2M2-11 TaxID=2787627 RepID=UPI0019D207DA|nr:dipeptide epimerase [Thalassotalea sp. G2M2-11]
MKITDISIGMVEVPLITPFKTAIRTVEQVKDIVVLIETDSGHIGYGEAPPTSVITGDTIASMKEAILHHLKPKLLGVEIENLNYICHTIQNAMVNNFSAKAAIEIAVYDLWAQMLGQPLYKALGGGDSKLTTDVTISVDYIDKMVADAVKAVEQGYETLKIKVGKDIGIDIERIKAIHAAVEGRSLLRLDANQGWTPKQAVKAINIIENAGINLELVEQPVKGHDIEGLKYIFDRVHTPIMADESSFGPREVIGLIQKQAADIINIKLMKTGGISRAIHIADIASTFGVDCMMGCMLESNISVSAAAHVAAAKSHSIRKIDLDGPLLCKTPSIQGGVTFDKSDVTLNESPGLGVKAINHFIPFND